MIPLKAVNSVMGGMRVGDSTVSGVTTLTPSAASAITHG